MRPEEKHSEKNSIGGGPRVPLAAAASAGAYQLDDGTVSASGFGLGGFSVIQSVWLNAFQSVAGLESITGVTIMFGAALIGDGLPANGTPIDVVLYSDPTNDGNPIDAVLQRQSAGTVQNADTGTFIDFAITPFTVTPGDWFFVGRPPPLRRM
ncbi:MAG: hypothetical protein R2729_20645 [Bryobacteraceae bacterium]